MRFRKAFVARAASILLLAAVLPCGVALRGEAGTRTVELRAGSRTTLLTRAASPPQSRAYERIAFASGREIFLVNSDGSGLTQLTHSDSGVYNFQPALSPDGTRVAFGRTGDDKPGIFILEVDGTGLRRLTTNHSGFDNEPAWSPDGSKIAFVRGFDTTSEGVANHTECGSEIYIVSVNDEAAEFNLTGSNLSSERGGGTDPSWSPDGTRIAFASNRGGSYDIYSITVEGGAVEQLTKTTTQEEAEPAWSPDGKRIAYAGNYLGALLYCGFAHTGLGSPSITTGPDIYVMASDGSGQTRLTFTENNIEPAWSPDGESLAFVSSRGGNTQTQVYIMSLSGGREFSITSDASYKLSPSWSRAGRGLLTGGK